MTKFTYTEGAGDGSTYGNGHHTQTLYVTNVDTGETRKYEGWTYMDADYWTDEQEQAGMEDDEMQLASEELQEILAAIWRNDEMWGYGIEEMAYTVV